MISNENAYDVIVIGGGPSGSTAATLLAKRGYRVVVFEREHFPRFHIGESLIPFTFPVLERLGLIDQMRASHFTKKYGVQFINEHGKLSEPFRFPDYDPHERSQTWQVVRSEFDEMLLNMKCCYSTYYWRVQTRYNECYRNRCRETWFDCETIFRCVCWCSTLVIY